MIFMYGVFYRTAGTVPFKGRQDALYRNRSLNVLCSFSAVLWLILKLVYILEVGSLGVDSWDKVAAVSP